MFQHPLFRIHHPLRALALLLTALLAGCYKFDDVRQSTVFPESEQGRVIQRVYALVTWIDIAIFLVVFGLLAWAVIRYRERAGQARRIPKQTHGNAMMEIVWTLIPAIVLVFIAVPTWEAIFSAARPPGENAVRVNAVGHQWWWEFAYPDLGIVAANELHIPVGKAAVIHPTSKDVIHSFWVPKLGGKADALPGKENLVWFTPDKIGTYYGQCVEYCGTSHANMRFRVIVDSEEQFTAWVAKQKTPQKADSPEAKEGEALFAQKGCIACHSIAGRPDALGQIGPSLTNLKDRKTLASALIDNTPANLSHWIRAPREIKPGALMILPQPVSEAESVKLAAYLMSAPGAAPASAPGTAAAAQAPAGAAAGGAEALIQAKICWTCHVIPGIANAKGTIGPDLTGLTKRPKIVAGLLDNNAANLKRWLKNPPAVKPGTAMPSLGLTDAEVDQLVKFLTGLK
jgi:cytochrome c oxidase subunit 2